MAGMGVYFARRSHDTDGYFLGGRKVPGWALGISMVGNAISSITFLALPAAAFALDWRQLTPNLFMPVAALMAYWLFIPFFRNHCRVTAYEYLGERYGQGIRLYAALYNLAAQLLRLAMVLCLMAIPLAEMLHIRESTAIIIFGAITCFYTVLGGIEAVIWTDVVQTFVLLGGAFLCVGVVIAKLPGGIAQVISVGNQFQKFSLGPLDFSFSDRTFFLMTIIGLLGFVTEFSSSQATVQRYIAAPSLKEARKATLLCAMISLPTWVLFFFLGTCMFVFYKIVPAPEIANMTSDNVLPHFILTQLRPGVSGLIIAAIMAAAMSTLSSSINAVSTIWTVDFLRVIRKRGDDALELTNARGAACVGGVVMILGAWGMSAMPRESLYDLGSITGAILCFAGLTPFMLGFFVPRVGNRAILFGMAAALLFSVYNILNHFSLLPSALSVKLHIYAATPVCNAVMLVAALLFAWICPERDRKRFQGLTVWDKHENGSEKKT